MNKTSLNPTYVVTRIYQLETRIQELKINIIKLETRNSEASLRLVPGQRDNLHVLIGQKQTWEEVFATLE